MKEMPKKNQLLLLFFIFSVNSLVISSILKLLGVNVFSLAGANYEIPIIGVAVKFIVLLMQYYFIVGCVVRYSPKDLFFKMIPFFPLVLVLYYTPANLYMVASALILFAPCLAYKPSFKSVVRFIFTIIFVMIIQLLILWLRLDIKSLLLVCPDYLQFAIMNIDQLIVLTLLYAINRKRGDNNGIFLFRKRN